MRIGRRADQRDSGNAARLVAAVVRHPGRRLSGEGGKDHAMNAGSMSARERNAGAAREIRLFQSRCPRAARDHSPARAGLPRAPSRARILVARPHVGGRPPVHRRRLVTVVRVPPSDDGVEDGQRSCHVRIGRPGPRSRHARVSKPWQRSRHVGVGRPGPRSRRVRVCRPGPRSRHTRVGRPWQRSRHVGVGRPWQRSCHVGVGRPGQRAMAAGLIVSAAG
jgi:hypothetical protein